MTIWVLIWRTISRENVWMISQTRINVDLDTCVGREGAGNFGAGYVAQIGFWIVIFEFRTNSRHHIHICAVKKYYELLGTM